LEAIQGVERTWHFRHNTNKNCTGSQETALHELGKQILVNNNQIAIPDHGTITYSDPITEKQFGDIRPDVSANYDGQQIFFEINVTHAVDKEKETFFKKGKHKSVEIDLNRGLTANYDEIQKMVLTEIENKKVVYWEEGQPNETNRNNTWINVTLGVIGIIAAYKLWKWLTNKILY
jgi:hypothetical protein